MAVFVNNIGVNGYVEIGPNFVREVNHRTLVNAGKYVISPNKLDEKFMLNSMNRFSQSFILMVKGDELSKVDLQKEKG